MLSVQKCGIPVGPAEKRKRKTEAPSKRAKPGWGCSEAIVDKIETTVAAVAGNRTPAETDPARHGGAVLRGLKLEEAMGMVTVLTPTAVPTQPLRRRRPIPMVVVPPRVARLLCQLPKPPLRPALSRWKRVAVVIVVGVSLALP